jgi:hypothetical protein
MEQPYRARLWTLFPGLFHEMNFTSDAHSTEVPVQDAIAVKIDFPSIRGFEKAVIFEKPRDLRLDLKLIPPCQYR